MREDRPGVGGLLCSRASRRRGADAFPPESETTDWRRPLEVPGAGTRLSNRGKCMSTHTELIRLELLQ